MTVAELIKELPAYPADMQVFTCASSEAGDYSTNVCLIKHRVLIDKYGDVYVTADSHPDGIEALEVG